MVGSSILHSLSYGRDEGLQISALRFDFNLNLRSSEQECNLYLILRPAGLPGYSWVVILFSEASCSCSQFCSCDVTGRRLR